MSWLYDAISCPGLFYGTSAQDGFLIRLRVPGGVINPLQARAIASLMAYTEQNQIQVTNRANLQLRGVKIAPSLPIYQDLQKLDLASQKSELDHLRNVMTSPTFAIDPQELINSYSLVKSIINYIENHPQIHQLSAKFSVGIDGAGQVGIGTRSPLTFEHRYNDLQFSAIKQEGEIYLHLALGGNKQLLDTKILIKPENLIPCFEVLTNLYLDYIINNHSAKKPRLRNLLEDKGLTFVIDQITKSLTFPYQLKKVSLAATLPYSYLGIHQQKQENLSYLGLSLSLGQITLKQWQGLLKILENFDLQEIRLTPWQSILLPNVPNFKLNQIINELENLDLSIDPDNPQSSIVACAGRSGCGRAITNTQDHGRILINYFQQHLQPKKPINLHLTACPKSCAQPSPAQITLLGTMIEDQGQLVEGYQIYVRDQENCTQTQIGELPFDQIPEMIVKLIN